MGKQLTVVLDPGHIAGYNKGVAPGYAEGNMVWKLAQFLTEYLQKDGVRVINTRPNINTDLDLYARGQVAVNNGAELFISLHSNAIGDQSRWEQAYGVSVYRSEYLPGSIDLGNKLADACVNVMRPVTGVTFSRGVLTRLGGAGDDYYGVIRGAVSGAKNLAAAAAGPVRHAFIIEHGFHTQSAECAFLNNDANLRKLAAAEAEVIKQHFGVNATPNIPSPSPTLTLTGGGEKDIWDYCRRFGISEIGAAAVCGQARAESAYNSCNLQNSFEAKLGFNDASYVAAVDSGSYNNFVRDSAGFGLFQWTFWSRKQGLLEYAKGKGASIGDFDMQMHYFWKEINEKYKGLLPLLKDSKDIVEVANALTQHYEAPGASVSPDPAVKFKCFNDRANFAKEAFNKFAGKPVADQPPQTTPVAPVPVEPEVPATPAAPAEPPVVEVSANGEVIGTIRVIYEGADGLNIHTTPEWGDHNLNTVNGPVKKGTFRVTEKIKVGGSVMFKLFSGAGYITGDETYVTFTPVAPIVTLPTKEIEVGSSVVVLRPITYTGGTFKLWHKTYEVKKLNGDRAVIGVGNAITCAINKNNLQLA